MIILGHGSKVVDTTLHVWLMRLFVPMTLVDNTSSGVTCKLETNVNQVEILFL